MPEIRRVLMTADTVGGVFTYAATLASELARDGITVHLATMGPAARPEQRARALSVPGLVLHEGTFALEWMDDPWPEVARAGEWLLALERELRPDLVHLNGYAHGSLDFEAPVVVVAHSCVLSWWRAVLGESAPSRYDTYRRVVRAGLRAADAVVAISRSMRTCLERHYGPLRHATVVHNGAPPPVHTGAETEKEPFVLSCGRVWDRAKNIEVLARAAAHVPWPVRVAGWDSNAHAGVESLGWLGRAELDAVMDRAAIFALPALYEPFGLSALEAAQRGAALVLGDIPSQREIWGDAALHVDPTDEDAIAEAITILARSPERRAELSRRARARAALYPASKMAAGLLDVYRTAWSRRRACA
jgi:glycosyltransferase involved in cell wall biosynthesis